jgi:hypothetical protein
MSFYNNNNNNTTTTTTTNINKNATNANAFELITFPKIIEDINKNWNDKLNDLKVLKEDIAHLERMFHTYPNDYSTNIFQCKELLKQHEINLKIEMQQIEAEAFQIKNKLFSKNF